MSKPKLEEARKQRPFSQWKARVKNEEPNLRAVQIRG